MSDTARDLVARLRALHEQATPGPWKCWNTFKVSGEVLGIHRIGPEAGHGGLRCYTHTPAPGDGDLFASPQDAELVAEMRTALPEILDALAAPPLDGATVLREAVEALTPTSLMVLHREEFRTVEEHRAVLLRYLLGGQTKEEWEDTPI